MTRTTMMKPRKSIACVAVVPAIALATPFLPMSVLDSYLVAALCLVSALIGLALFFYVRERKAGQPRSVGFMVLFVVALILTVLFFLPAIS